MQKSEDAATHMNSVDMKYLAGNPIEHVKPLPPYDSRVCGFLAELSRRLKKDARAKAYPDVLSFAFFCRGGNISRLARQFRDERDRIGKGLVFHIAPSNVPVTCAYTYVFGLLAGNANIVRVPSKESGQVHVICDVMRQMFDTGMYEEIRQMTAFVSYERNSEINDALSKTANVRVIWGGDETIRRIRQSPLSPRGTELTFADRYSIAVIDAVKILDLNDKELVHLAGQFYNDTYLMDQNACSSPSLILWLHKGEHGFTEGKRKFWAAVALAAAKYDLADIKVSDKYVQLCKCAVESEDIDLIERYGNLLYVVTLDSLKQDITGYRGRFGLFFQYDMDNLEEIIKHLTNKIQTCIYYGIERQKIIQLIIENSCLGIDRVVPVGSSLDIGVYWDGYDIIGQMSRVIG